MLNKSVLSLVPRLATRRYPHSLLNAGACSRRYRSIAGTRRPQGAQQQTSRCCCRSTGQVERTDTRPLHRPCSAYSAGSVSSASKLRGILHVSLWFDDASTPLISLIISTSEFYCRILMPDARQLGITCLCITRVAYGLICYSSACEPGNKRSLLEHAPCACLPWL